MHDAHASMVIWSRHVALEMSRKSCQPVMVDNVEGARA